jgi:hypothetical protein
MELMHIHVEVLRGLSMIERDQRRDSNERESTP